MPLDIRFINFISLTDGGNRFVLNKSEESP